MGKMEKQPRINRRKLVICIVKTIIISAIAILFVMPLIWMGLSALKTTNEVFAHPFKWLPAKPIGISCWYDRKVHNRRISANPSGCRCCQ